MTREEAIFKLKDLLIPTTLGSKCIGEFDKPAIDYAIQALEQESCDDCVSRQAVLDIAKSSKSNWIDNSVLFKRVNELPPVLPKREQGEWRQNGTGYNDAPIYECSQCGRGVEFGSDGSFKSCPYCGAEMR